jgi:hypothetical protein
MESKSNPDSEALELLLSDYASDAVKDIYAQFNVPAAEQRRLLFTAIRYLGVMLSVDPAKVNEEFFLTCVANDAADYAASLAPKPPPQVSSPSTLARIFKRGKFAPDHSAGVELYTWQSELPDGLGPLLYATSSTDPELESVLLLLETGEIKELSKTGASLLLSPADPGEYATVPLHLLACEVVRECCNADFPPAEAAVFGSFNVPLRMCYAPVAELQAFENPPPGGVQTLFRVDDSLYRVRLVSTDVPGGFSITAQLLDAEGFVVMRLDTPRRFSVSGVYLFPMQEAAYALVVY